MLDFQGMLNDFKRTDIDPRELVLLYSKQLLAKNDSESLKKHFNKTDFQFDVSTIIERFKMDNDKMGLNTEQKVKESKQTVIQILEHKNQLFASDLSKYPTKSI